MSLVCHWASKSIGDIRPVHVARNPTAPPASPTFVIAIRLAVGSLKWLVRCLRPRPRTLCRDIKQSMLFKLLEKCTRARDVPRVQRNRILALLDSWYYKSCNYKDGVRNCTSSTHRVARCSIRIVRKMSCYY